MTSDDRPSLEEALANARAWQAQSAAVTSEQPKGPAEQGDAIEVLTHGSLRLAKRVHADGSIDSYDDAKMFKRRTHQVRNLEGFYELQRDELQHDPHTAIIRGRWRGADQVETDHDKHAQPNYVRKALHYFEDQPLHLVCIDVDKTRPAPATRSTPTRSTSTS